MGWSQGWTTLFSTPGPLGPIQGYYHYQDAELSLNIRGEAYYLCSQATRLDYFLNQGYLRATLTAPGRKLLAREEVGAINFFSKRKARSRVERLLEKLPDCSELVMP
jgi:YHS domain-containing protein